MPTAPAFNPGDLPRQHLALYVAEPRIGITGCVRLDLNHPPKTSLHRSPLKKSSSISQKKNESIERIFHTDHAEHDPRNPANISEEDLKTPHLAIKTAKAKQMTLPTRVIPFQRRHIYVIALKSPVQKQTNKSV